MLAQFQALLEKNLSLVLVLSGVLGLVVPGLDALPLWLVMVSLGTMIFSACYQGDLGALRQVSLSRLFLFYLLRFVLLPMLLFWLALAVAKPLALSVLLLALCPAGMSGPAFSALFKGDVPFTMASVIIGSLLTPFVLPFILMGLTPYKLQVEPLALLLNLSMLIFLPALLFALAKRFLPTWHARLRPKASLLTIASLSLLIAVSMARQKATVFTQPEALPALLLTLFVVFLLLYVTGALLGKVCSPSTSETTTYMIAGSISSGVNNLGLGLTLALQYLPDNVVLFLVLANIPWILLLVPFKVWSSRRLALA